MAQYISKDALVAEMERRIDDLYDFLPDASKVENGTITISEACNTGKYTALESFRNYIDTLEVKEVDLEKEVITTEELRAEIKRRWLLEQEEKKKALRCRNCVHCVRHPSGWLKMYLCDARTWGKKIKRNYCVNLSDKACELFENKHKEE